MEGDMESKVRKGPTSFVNEKVWQWQTKHVMPFHYLIPQNKKHNIKRNLCFSEVLKLL